MNTHICGFPRIGAARELKRALEAYWRGSIALEELTSTGNALKERHWAAQKAAGLSYVTTGDFSYYDHVLDTAFMLGCIPERFRSDTAACEDSLFRMARGDASRNIPAMEMTKWFNTNYHYIVPECPAGQHIRRQHHCVTGDTRRALALGHAPKPVLLGPVTFLSLAKGTEGHSCWDRLEDICAVYREVLSELDPLCDIIQIDEPILCADMTPEARAAFPRAYELLNGTLSHAGIMLATYFDALDDNLDLALASGCAALHVDLVRGASSLESLLVRLPGHMKLSAGIVEGRNIWKTDYEKALSTLNRIADRLGADRLLVGSSCSLLHVPVDLEGETDLDPELRSWLAFAVQKCREISELAFLVQESGGTVSSEGAILLEANSAAIRSRRVSGRVHNPAVAARCAAIAPAMLERNTPHAQRRVAQQWLNLPPFPTTTIGSYPQTPEIRTARSQFKKGHMRPEAYEEFIRNEIAAVVRQQEELGLDVLVHGEPERNDMVEYFGQQMDGFCFTRNGWVQSYGSRCVKPPVIFGDVSRPVPMTVKWIQYAASLTEKPTKGTLTGPATILCWSFVRDDMDRADVCRQLALAVRDEVADLEAAGIRIIQIDEAAFSEGMPIKQRDGQAYLDWAAANFRLATCCVEDATQIHTHMCYSEFNSIIAAIAAMDADVISIESSRSGMELLEAFRTFEYPNEIGPGVYDIHSPRVPDEQEMVSLLERALAFIPADRLWVNPDCGLKTRCWPETLASLRNMVAAAQTMRQRG
ncbi:MAG: 5-methyltetrahydropteroyltriglutamate--homocysteine S-methyltransferase [Halodesulfovibrio sp.]